MFHPKMQAFDKRMKEMFDEIDDVLEEKYGNRYPIHPNRPTRGATSNKAADGLFNVGVQFTAGYGSELGRGYTVDMNIATLENIPENEREDLLLFTVELIQEKLPIFFPEKNLTCARDRNLFKILGNFQLGTL
ncbi:MAG: hypothetical protein GW949_03210 [Spirochaetales bacterium]|nr:hypothetical protein [Spirochaetales bacterium]